RQSARDGNILGDGIEIVAHVVEVEDAPVAPEILGVSEQVALMLRNGYRNAALDRLVVALALVTVMVRVKNPVHLADAQVAQVVQDFAGPEVDEHAVGAVTDDVDGAGVLETIEVFAQSLGRARGRERASPIPSLARLFFRC